jgi:ElaA protein
MGERMELQIKKFDELTVTELYNILALRTDVFVVEQNCAYAELDHHDQTSYHIIGTVDNQLVAYARVVPPGGVYAEPSIGRVVVAPKHRRAAYGKKVFAKAVELGKEVYAQEEKLKIQAQVYLEEFYSSFGFETISEPYPDFGVWHVDMIKKI